MPRACGTAGSRPSKQARRGPSGRAATPGSTKPSIVTTRAFTDADKAPAWDRIRELEARRPAPAPFERELEQKFGILYSLAQAHRDLDLWTSEAAGIKDYCVGVIFLDVDDFKQLNTNFTESIVDRTLLPELQQLVRGLCLHRGAAYRYGGEELLVLLPNCPLDEASAFAEKVRGQIARHQFQVEEQPVQVTVSVGVAAWPVHGSTLPAVIERANREERSAKEQGKDRVFIATAQQRVGADRAYVRQMDASSARQVDLE